MDQIPKLKQEYENNPAFLPIISPVLVNKKKKPFSAEKFLHLYLMHSDGWLHQLVRGLVWGALTHKGVRTGGQGVVNMTALNGLGNAEATGFLVNLWTA